jgi:antitoxin ParD1/3/4
MAGMNVSLTDELTRFVQETVNSGLYHSASEVVRDALRLLQEREQSRMLKLSRLREEIATGLAQVDAGQVVDFDAEAIKAEGRALLEGRPAK